MLVRGSITLHWNPSTPILRTDVQTYIGDVVGRKFHSTGPDRLSDRRKEGTRPLASSRNIPRPTRKPRRDLRQAVQDPAQTSNGQEKLNILDTLPYLPFYICLPICALRFVSLDRCRGGSPQTFFFSFLFSK